MAQHPRNVVTSIQVDGIVLRPYQLTCLICRLGENQCATDGQNRFRELNAQPWWQRKHCFLEQVLDTIQRAPDTPVMLRCNATGVFSWQTPGPADDSPEGADYNAKRDLDILRQLDLAPGCMLPARALLYRMQNHLKNGAGICGYDTVTADAWQGCPKSGSGFYERGNKIDIDDIIPMRTDAERAVAKRESMRVVERADAVTIRPHLLLCTVCQYGAGIRPPFDPDNLPELLQMILKNPEIRLTMTPGADWMMCAPCKRRDPATGACENICGLGGLSNELRDLNTLQLLGLSYGATMKAENMFRLLFERCPTTQAVCTKNNSEKRSVWWDSCGDRESGADDYARGREELQALGLGATNPG